MDVKEVELTQLWSRVIEEVAVDAPQHRAFLQLTKPLGLLQGSGITNLLVALLRSEIRPQGKLQASSFVFRLSAPAPCFPALLLADTLHGFPERPVVSPQVFLRASRPGRPGFPSGTSQSNIDRWQTP